MTNNKTTNNWLRMRILNMPRACSYLWATLANGDNFLPETTVLDRLDRSTYLYLVKPLQLQLAKQQFSAVAEKAAGGEPQIVTKHGKPFVVIVGIADWQQNRHPLRTLLEVLHSCPADLTELNLTRDKDLPRDIIL